VSYGEQKQATLSDALADERETLLELELARDETPPEPEEEPRKKRLKRELAREALARLEESARSEGEFEEVVRIWDKLEQNEVRRVGNHEVGRGDIPLEWGMAKDGYFFPAPNTLLRQIQKGLRGDRPRLYPPWKLPQFTGTEQGISPNVAGEHGTARDHYCGYVQPGGGHEHPGDDLITARQQHHGVEVVGFYYHLNAVGDEVPAGQGVAHPLVALAQPITDGNGLAAPGNAASLDDALAYRFRQLPQVGMARDHLAEGADHRYEGLFQVLLVHASGVEQGALAAAANTVGQGAAAVAGIFENKIVLKIHGNASS